MNAHDIRLVKQSFANLSGRETGFVGEFYALLFARVPELRDLFPADMADQQFRFRAMLRFIIAGLEDWATTLTRIEALGRAHRSYGAQPHHYELVADCVLDALRSAMGSELSPEELRAWQTLMSTFSRVMVEALEYTDRDEVSGITSPFTPIMGVSISAYARFAREFGRTAPSSDRLAQLGLDQQTWYAICEGWNTRLTDVLYGPIVASAYVSEYEKAEKE